MECNLVWNHTRDFKNRTSVQRKFDLKSQVWFQTKIAWHKVQLPLYYTCFIVNINILFLLLHFQFDELKKGCDLEQKRCNLGINRIVESQSDCKDYQWFQNGCNKCTYRIEVKLNCLTPMCIHLYKITDFWT